MEIFKLRIKGFFGWPTILFKAVSYTLALLAYIKVQAIMPFYYGYSPFANKTLN